MTDRIQVVTVGVPGTRGQTGNTGATGLAGPTGLNWRGAWVSGTTYALNDAVAHNGASFRWTNASSLQSNTQPVDGHANWAVVAAKGAQGDLGLTGPAGPSGLTLRRQMQILANAGATTFSTVGMASGPVVASPATIQAVSSSRGPYVTVATASAVGEVASVRTAYSLVEARWDPDVTLDVRVGGTADRRMWAGLFSADPSGAATHLIHHAAFRFDTGAGDTAWRCVLGNAGTATVTGSGAAPQTNVAQVLRVAVRSGTDVRFWIDDVLVATVLQSSGVLPDPTALMGLFVGVTNLATGTRQIGVSRFAVEHV